MSSKNTYMTPTNTRLNGQVLTLSSDIESTIATEILSINVLIIGLVLIIINAALIA